MFHSKLRTAYRAAALGGLSLGLAGVLAATAEATTEAAAVPASTKATVSRAAAGDVAPQSVHRVKCSKKGAFRLYRTDGKKKGMRCYAGTGTIKVRGTFQTFRPGKNSGTIYYKVPKRGCGDGSFPFFAESGSSKHAFCGDLTRVSVKRIRIDGH